MQPSMELEPLTPQGHLHSHDIPPDSQSPHLSVGPACFATPPLLPALIWLLFYILSYSSVRLVFRLFSRVMILKFSCSLNVVAGGDKHHIAYLLHHLDWKWVGAIIITIS